MATAVLQKRQASYDDDSYTYTDEYKVVESSDRITAVLAVGVLLGYPSPDDLAAYCSNIDVDEIENGCWSVTVEYSTSTEEDGDLAPWMREPEGSGDATLIEIPQQTDLNGDLICFSNGQVPEPALSIHLPIMSRTVSMSVYGRGLSQYYSSFVGCVNVNTWFGMEAGSVLVENVRSENLNWTGGNAIAIPYERLTFTYRVRLQGNAYSRWNQPLLQLGTWEIVNKLDADGNSARDDQGKLIKIRSFKGAQDADKNIVPKLLDMEGKFLSQDKIDAGIFYVTQEWMQYLPTSFKPLPWA